MTRRRVRLRVRVRFPGRIPGRSGDGGSWWKPKASRRGGGRGGGRGGQVRWGWVRLGAHLLFIGGYCGLG